MDPEWGVRVTNFRVSVKASGIETDEKILFLTEEYQEELIYNLARENRVDIKLIKSE